MTQLVYLVWPDGEHLPPLPERSEVGGRGGNERDPRTRPGDLRGRPEQHQAVFGAVPPAGVHDVGQPGRIVVEVVDGIGVVAHDPEVRTRDRAEPAEPVDGGVGVHLSTRVRVLGHAPDALHRGVLPDPRFDQVHVRTVIPHRHVDHLDPEVFENREVPVVAGDRAQEPHGAAVAPGGARFGGPVEPRVQQVAIHQRQAAVPPGDHLVGADPEQRGPEHPCLRQSVDPAVVPGVGAVGGQEPALNGVEPVRERELRRVGLATCEVECETGVAKAPMGRVELALPCAQRILRETVECHADVPPGGRSMTSLRAAVGAARLVSGPCLPSASYSDQPAHRSTPRRARLAR